MKENVKTESKKTNDKAFSIPWLFVLSGCIHIGLMAFGAWQDATMDVKYTDVDYQVVTDGAALVYQGDTPYARTTYRYTPFLAEILMPCVKHPYFGKLLFSAFDLLTGKVMLEILRNRMASNFVQFWALACWLLNPMILTISTRGNCESILCFLVLSTMYFLETNQLQMAAVALSLSVHFKIYPLIYLLPILLQLTRKQKYEKTDNALRRLYKFILSFINDRVFSFLMTFLGTLLSVTLFYYSKYGYDFLESAYIYHIRRIDHRHNFSIYFYNLYLHYETSSNSSYALVFRLMSFLPQVILLFASSFALSHDIIVACFVQTFIFVSFNKVITSQYFLWYLCFLPVLPTAVSFKNFRIPVFLSSLWIICQAIWLKYAYQHEFLGLSQFRQLMSSSCIMLCCNSYVISSITHHLTKRKEKVRVS